MQHHLSALGRDKDGYGTERLTIFARNKQQAIDPLRTFRDAGGVYCTFRTTTDLGLGGDIDAHVAYAADVKRLYDGG